MRSAERALHHRTELACAAATDAGLPGRFRVWEQDGLLAVLVTDPALSFLSTVSGVEPENLAAAVDLVGDPVWGGVRPALIGSSELELPGFTRAADRGLAVRRLGEHTASPDVVDGDARFARILLAGYEVEGTVAAFIDAEHRRPEVRRFLLLEHDVPIAAAAMTVHGDVAVLGGASTLRAHRGKGAQPRLLGHRLRMAADAGCSLAVATAVPGSVSAANLTRAGFTFHLRPTWLPPAQGRLAR
jgi:GNAT superfamily N-acetyltransferase